MMHHPSSTSSRLVLFPAPLLHTDNTFESLSNVPSRWRKRRQTKNTSRERKRSGSFGAVFVLVPQNHHVKRSLLHQRREADATRPQTLSIDSACEDDPQDVVRQRNHIVSTRAIKSNNCIITPAKQVLRRPPLTLRNLVCKECLATTLGINGGLPSEFLHEMSTIWQLAHADKQAIGVQGRSILPRPLGVVIPKLHNKTPRLVMEEGGQNLQSLLVNPPEGMRLTPSERRQIIHRVVHHVLFLWCVYRLVHLDLKPQNIMITNFRDPHKPLRVWLVDWGASASIERLMLQPINFHITTMWYEAPEAIVTLPQTGLPQDKWSLGCVLWAICFDGFPPTTGYSYIDHFWQQCNMFGTPTSSNPPWCNRRTAARAVQNAPKWPRGGAVLQSKRAHMNNIWTGLGDLVVDGLLQMNPQRRWSTQRIKQHFGLHFPPPQPWRFMSTHPVISWDPTQRAARHLMKGHTEVECVTHSAKRVRLVHIVAMLKPLGFMRQQRDEIHPMFSVFAMRLLDTAVRRLLPFGWKHRNIVVEVPISGSPHVRLEPSNDARLFTYTCFMITMKWFSGSVIVDSEIIASLFDITSNRTIGRMIELERDIVRACPDLLGIEGFASAYLKIDQHLRHRCRRKPRVGLLGSALLLRAMLLQPALWRFARNALIQDIKLLQNRIMANSMWSHLRLTQDIPWLNEHSCSLPVDEVWWLATNISMNDVNWVRRAIRLLTKTKI